MEYALFASSLTFFRWLVSKSLSRPAVPHILVIDIGSSSIRCTAFELKANNSLHLIPSATSRFKLKLSDYEHNVEIVVETINLAVRECVCLLKNQQNIHIQAVGFASLAMSLIGMETVNNKEYLCGNLEEGVRAAAGAGRSHLSDRGVLQRTPLFSYSPASHLTASHSLSLATVLAEFSSLSAHKQQQHHDETGTVLAHTAYAPLQLAAYVKCGEADLRGVRFVSIAEVVSCWWTGRTSFSSSLVRLSFCEASWTGLLDWKELQWSKAALEYSNIDDSCLPQLCDWDENTAVISDSRLVQSVPELEGAKIYHGIGDGAAACVSSRCCCSHRISITIGTTAAVRVIRPVHQMATGTALPLGLWCYRINRTHVVVGGALSDGGNVIEWLSNLIGPEQLERCMMKVEGWCSTPAQLQDEARTNRFPDVLPFFSGERSTGWRSEATAVLAGLTQSTSASSILYSLMEAVCFRLSAILDEMSQASLCCERGEEACLVVSGGALETNKTWRQMLADISGYSVLLIKPPAGGEMTTAGIAALIESSLSGNSFALNGTCSETRPCWKSKESKWGFSEEEIVSISLSRRSFASYYNSRRERHQNLYSSHKMC